MRIANIMFYTLLIIIGFIIGSVICLAIIKVIEKVG